MADGMGDGGGLSIVAFDGARVDCGVLFGSCAESLRFFEFAARSPSLKWYAPCLLFWSAKGVDIDRDGGLGRPSLARESFSSIARNFGLSLNASDRRELTALCSSLANLDRP